MTFVADKTNRLLQDPSAVLLIFTNLAVLGSALYFQWDIFTLMLLYWLETAIIGFFTIAKLIHSARWAALGLVPFFSFHFGMFMFVHLVFLFALFGNNASTTNTLLPTAGLFAAFPTIAFAAAGLFISHLYSFFTNYLGQREYETKNPMYFFAYPYPRVIVMHITIIASGFFVMLLSPAIGLLILSLLKTAADIVAHRKAHQ